jgi:hypothetical protein
MAKSEAELMLFDLSQWTQTERLGADINERLNDIWHRSD